MEETAQIIGKWAMKKNHRLGISFFVLYSSGLILGVLKRSYILQLETKKNFF